MNQSEDSDDNQPSSPEPGITQQANDSAFDGGQQATIGDSSIQNQGNNNWLGNTWNVFFGQQTTPVGNPARPKNEQRLLALVKEEVTTRLRDSLHNAVLINLGKESQPPQVKRPYDAYIKMGRKPPEPLPNTTTILEVFDSEEITGKLLILGAPGAGKTTTLLELAQALIKRAEEHPDYPVPVLLNLSSWKDDRQSLTDWLVAELKSKPRYGFDKKIGKQWVTEQVVLPLLDGLDEVAPERQNLCVRQINGFLAGESAPRYAVVCSRIEEYENYKTALQLNGAVYLKGLSDQQIQNYLTKVRRQELWDLIARSPELLAFLRTPLLLSIAVLTYPQNTTEQWQQLQTANDQLQYLLDGYVEQMLHRPFEIESSPYRRRIPPTPRQTLHWLIWLARQMEKVNQTEFLIREIPPYIVFYILPLDQQKKYWVIVGLIGGFVGGLGVELIYGWMPGLSVGLILGMGVGLSGGLNARPNGGLIALMRLPILMMRCLCVRLTDGLVCWLSFGLIFGLVMGLPLGLFTMMNGLIYGLPLLGIPSWSFLGLFIGLFGGLFGGLFLALLFGVQFLLVGMLGMSDNYAQDFMLHLFLYQSKLIPWNYARFLDYCTERLFLQRVGGRYRFIHKLLQDHFAQMEFKRN